MPRNKTSKTDWRRYRKFEQENEKLRKEVSKLRKVINNLVVDQLEERAKKVDEGEDPVTLVCEVCGNEDLHSVPIKRADGNFEIRICKSCSHRSQLKRKKDAPK
jgi:transcription elongation factor Elf1